jgi:hypothetical protein
LHTPVHELQLFAVPTQAPDAGVVEHPGQRSQDEQDAHDCMTLPAHTKAPASPSGTEPPSAIALDSGVEPASTVSSPAPPSTTDESVPPPSVGLELPLPPQPQMTGTMATNAQQPELRSLPKSILTPPSCAFLEDETALH